MKPPKQPAQPDAANRYLWVSFMTLLFMVGLCIVVYLIGQGVVSFCQWANDYDQTQTILRNVPENLNCTSNWLQMEIVDANHHSHHYAADLSAIEFVQIENLKQQIADLSNRVSALEPKPTNAVPDWNRSTNYLVITNGLALIPITNGWISFQTNDCYINQYQSPTNLGWSHKKP